MSPHAEQPTWRLQRNHFGRLGLTDAQGVDHTGVVPVRAFPIGAPDEGLSLVGGDGHELVWVDRLSALPTDVRDDQFRRVERDYGAFSRSFTLPNTVDSAKVSADFKNGVLTIRLPFREEAKPRTINVEVAA